MKMTKNENDRVGSPESAPIHLQQILTLLLSERPKLCGVLAVLSATGLKQKTVLQTINSHLDISLFQW